MTSYSGDMFTYLDSKKDLKEAPKSPLKGTFKNKKIFVFNV
jgi:hypothetical protein